MSIPDVPPPGPQHPVTLDASGAPLPASDAPRYRLPVTAYIWFVLLCIGALWSRLPNAPRTGASLSQAASEGAGANVKKGDGARIDSGSAQAFTNLVEAERLTRVALAGPFLSQNLTGLARESGRATGAPPPSRPDDPQRSARKLYEDAIRQTRALAVRTGSVNFARRAVVLEHAAGRPLDEKYLRGQLTKNLQGRDRKPAEIAEELTFWRGLYGNPSARAGSGSLVATADRLLEDMQLGLLEDKVRADARRASGDTVGADRLDDKVGSTALRSFVLMGLATGAIALALVVDFALLIGLVVFAATKQLRSVRPVPAPATPPQVWGLLIDCFVFYFALLFISRPVLGLLAERLVPGGPGSASPTVALGLTSIGYLLVHGIAAAYTVVLLRRHNLSLDVIGFNRRNLLHNVGWGILGYCVALPLVAGLGAIASALFRDNPNITPNPALPLLTSAEGLGPRLLIFALVAIGAPLWEEFFFRGVLYTGLRARWGVAASIAVSALLFAIGHPVQDWLPILGLGAVFAALREWRKSVVPGMVAHFLQNGLTFLTLSALFSR